MTIFFECSHWRRLPIKTCVICLFFATAAISSYSQDLPKPLISEIELLAGLQASKPMKEDGNRKEDKVKYGPCFNLGLLHRFSDRFGLSLNVQYESKGKKYDGYQNNGGDPPVQQHSISKYTFVYASGALITKWYPSRKIDLYVGAGPYVGYATKETYENEIYLDGVLVIRNGGKLPSDEFRDYDFGMTVVTGYDHPFGEKIKLSTRIYYGFGFRPYTMPDRYEFTNSAVSLQLGIVFLRSIRLNF